MSRWSRCLGIAFGWLAVTAAAPADADLPLLPPPPATPVTIQSPVPELLPPPPDATPPAIDAPAPDDKAAEPQTPAAAPAKGDSCQFYVGGDGMEYLLWWMPSAPLPPLVTRNRTGPPILGMPDTRVLIGGTPMDLNAFSGGRFTLGSNLGYSEYGIEGTYFFLGTRTDRAVVAGGGANLGRPIVDAVTGAETILPVNGFGTTNGVAQVASSARAEGVEGTVLAHLMHNEAGSLTALVGYRFLLVNEGVNVSQTGTLYAGPTTYGLNDQIDAHNRFHGGQIGLRGDTHRGPMFVEFAGKIAFGQTTEVVSAGGITSITPAPGTTQYMNGGLFALGTDTGRVVREAFAVLPEAQIKIGFFSGDSRIFVGYDFLYLSSAVRPGDQIDRTVNLGQVPVLGSNGAFTGPERPQLAVKSTDFWLQGLMFGLETRW
jgi:hypothetical protein